MAEPAEARVVGARRITPATNATGAVAQAFCLARTRRPQRRDSHSDRAVAVLRAPRPRHDRRPDTQSFDSTLRENPRLAKPSANDDDLVRAGMARALLSDLSILTATAERPAAVVTRCGKSTRSAAHRSRRCTGTEYALGIDRFRGSGRSGGNSGKAIQRCSASSAAVMRCRGGTIRSSSETRRATVR